MSEDHTATSIASSLEDGNASVSALPNDICQSIAIANIKSISEQPALLSNLIYANLINNVNLSQQNAVANQQAMNELGIAITGKSVNLVSDLGPVEAASAREILTGNSLAEEIAALKASIAAFTVPSGNKTT